MFGHHIIFKTIKDKKNIKAAASRVRYDVKMITNIMIY